MDVQAYFSDIRATIVRELAAARRGCRVRVALLDDFINRRSGLNLERFPNHELADSA